MAPCILIVDDEADIVATVALNLRRAGYVTRETDSGAGAIELASRAPVPDLVILDLMLPDIPGTEVCRRLRGQAATAKVPILMLTARGEEIDRVVGFEVGADDYMVKPFSMRELLLRVAAILRRARPAANASRVTEAGPVRVDPDGHRVWVEDREVTLTALELRLLSTLLSRRGRVQSRQVLLEDVWAVSSDITTRTVDTHIKRLREKLGSAGVLIQTVRGVGYRFAAPDGE
jgi:two-component system, OmpR family, phosphate regulon response regulator PhoB